MWLVQPRGSVTLKKQHPGPFVFWFDFGPVISSVPVSRQRTQNERETGLQQNQTRPDWMLAQCHPSKNCWPRPVIYKRETRLIIYAAEEPEGDVLLLLFEVLILIVI